MPKTRNSERMNTWLNVKIETPRTVKPEASLSLCWTVVVGRLGISISKIHRYARARSGHQRGSVVAAVSPTGRLNRKIQTEWLLPFLAMDPCSAVDAVVSIGHGRCVEKPRSSMLRQQAQLLVPTVQDPRSSKRSRCRVEEICSE